MFDRSFWLCLCWWLMTITFVWAAKYPIIVDNEKSMHRFPYKPIYGLPDNLNCTNDLRKKFNECEDDASETWSITIDEYVRNFYLIKEKILKIIHFCFE